jgi:ABC-2 type transport system ATP-binding protein
MDVIEMRSVGKRFGEVRALQGIDLGVPEGSLFGFLGPNGAGKTTAMRILLGLLRAGSGQARVLGRDAWGQSTSIRRDVGFLPGDVRLYEWMRGREVVALCDRARGGGHGSEISRLRGRLDLDLGRRVRDYSRGMKQKLGLITALMHRPRLLILDEPTTALDPLMQQVLYDELRAASAEGRTVLLSSHTLSEVEALCDRVAIVRAGRIIEDSTIARLRERAARRVVVRPGAAAERAAFPAEWVGAAGADGVLRGTWKGPVHDLLGWLATMRAEDVTISPPDLEDLFSAYYREG